MTVNRKWRVDDYKNAGIVLGLIGGAVTSYSQWMALGESFPLVGWSLLAWWALLPMLPLGAAIYLRPNPPVPVSNQEVRDGQS